MAKTLSDLPIGGFVAQEVAFSQLFDRLGASAKNIIRQEVIEPAVNAQHFPSNNQFCLITVLGHSDRVDTAGLSTEQRRAQELDASDKRAGSAGAWVFDQITAALTAAGETPPASVQNATNFDIVTMPCGAAALLNVVPASEAQRAENRRVQFVISTFAP
jgi:outer membrane protein OmpA-like peptidoglycan-associated protein